MSRNSKSTDIKKRYCQYFTPKLLSEKLIENLDFKKSDKILEPSFGDGQLIIQIIKKLLLVYNKKSKEEAINDILSNNIYGYEISEYLLEKTIQNIENEFGIKILNHNLKIKDFFLVETEFYDYIIANPPYCGSFDETYEEELDDKFGNRLDEKIKKETSSFFLLKLIEHHLKDNGKLISIVPDNILTLYTLRGLRKFISLSGYIELKTIEKYSKDINCENLLLSFTKKLKSDFLLLNNEKIYFDDIKETPNFGWTLNNDFKKYFGDKTIADYMIGSGGLTTGKNELFVRKIMQGDLIIENYDFELINEPISLEKEIWRAKFNKLTDKKIKEIKEKEEKGETKISVKIEEKNVEIVKIPNDDYCYYNKSNDNIIYSKPEYVIYWKNDGEILKTYKKTGKYHLQGIGGEEHYKKEGITWYLISDTIKARFLPSGYIFDNSAPVLLIRDDVDNDELYFILSWLLSELATKILKNVINNSRNIQSKDLERMPYPFWIDDKTKSELINETKNIITNLTNNENVDIDKYLQYINNKIN